MPRTCAAYGCSNNASKESCKNKKISFHRFPLHNDDLLKRWLAQIKRQDFLPKKHSVLCSEHFNEDDFFYQPFTNRKEIKKDSVPSMFVYKRTLERELKSYQLGASVAVSDVIEPVPEPATRDACCQTDMNIIEILMEQNTKLEEELKELKEKFEKTKICPQNLNNEELHLITGYDKTQFAVLSNFLEFNEAKDVQRFFIFLIRLRTGITEDVLGIFFHKSQSYISKLIVSMISIVYEKIKPVDIWPSKEKIKMFMPSAFSENYPECRVIVDATEFCIQKPSDPIEQQTTFSYYENTNTIKCMIGITPAGGISFISDTSGGSVSDKDLFVQSGIMNLLEKGDVVMADRGFSVGEELKSIGCELKTPNFLKEKIQFDFSERKENNKIAKHRIYVERAIRRIKIFKLLNGKIPYNMLAKIDEIIYIIAFFINFGNPLINL